MANFLEQLHREIKRQYWYTRGPHLVPNAEWLLCVPSESPVWKLHILFVECAYCTRFEQQLLFPITGLTVWSL
jgi:hypothetical protein